MVQGLFGIIGTYFVGAMIVHLAYNRVNPHGSGLKHYVLYTMNNQLHIEWIVRSLILFSWLHGKPIAITIIDEGSTDDTLAIVRSLSRRHRLDVLYAGDHLQDGIPPCPEPCSETIHIRLNQIEDMRKYGLRG